MEDYGTYLHLYDVCYTCGKRLFVYYGKYKKLRENGLSFEEAMAKLGINRYCCRARMFSPIIIPNRSIFDMSTTIVPEPIVLKQEPLNEENVELPGEIKIDESGKFLKRYLTYEGFTGDLLAGYNNWIENILPNQLLSKGIELPDGRTVVITDPEIRPPSKTVPNKEELEPIYPIECIQKDLTYSANIYVNIKIINRNGMIIEEDKDKILLCSIPVMLGSVICNLYGMTPTQRAEHGECPNDPLGYFIIQGKRRVLQIQEKLRVNRIFNFPSPKGDPLSSITCSTITGTSTVKLSLKSNNTIYLEMSFMDKKIIPVFLLYYKFNIDVDEIVNSVLETVRDEWKSKVYVYIQSSILDATTSEVDIKEENLNEYIENLFTQMNEDLYNEDGSLNDVIVINKFNYLSLMIARFSEVQLGLRPYDDRDDVGNKRFENAGRLMEQLFIKAYNKMLDSIQHKITTEQIKTTGITTIKSNIAQNGITSAFLTSFKTNNWGIYSTHNKASIVENISEILNNVNIISIYSHLVRINVPARREAKQNTIRLVSMSQLGYIDPIETPEGKNCGLIRSKALTCYITIDLNPENIINTIKPFIVNVNDSKHNSPCIFNGIFMGWCEGKKVKDEIIKLRRSSLDYRGLAVVLDKDNVLIIYSDGGRPTRPLLVVENGELVIDKKNLWNASFQELIRQGALEYIDAHEQEYLTIAMNIELIRYKEEQLDNLLDEPHIVDKSNLFYKSMREIMKSEDYTHCELDPTAIMGISSSLIPLANHNQAPRNTLQCNMSRQAVAVYHSNYLNNFEAGSKVLAFPSRPIFETQIADIIGLNELPVGQTVMLAILPYKGFTQEDAFIFNKSSIEMGLFNMAFYKTYKEKLVSKSKDYVEVFKGPEERKGKYRNLDDDGIAKIGSVLRQNDVIISKLRIFNDRTKEPERIDKHLYFSEEGIVVKRLISDKADGKTVKVVIKFPTSPTKFYQPIQGDKFACYTKNHEILTKSGWINIAEINAFDEIATLDGDQIIFQRPLNIMDYEYNGYIYKSNNGISFEVTSNHRMYIYEDGKYIIKTAENIRGLSIHRRTAINNNIKTFDGHYIGMQYFSADEWLYIYGKLLIDGKIISNDIITCKIYNYLMSLLHKHNIKYKIKCNKVYIYNKILVNDLRSNNFLNNWLYGLTMEQASTLLSVMTLGKNEIYTNKNIKDIIMSLAFMSNRYANAERKFLKWKITIKNNQNTVIDNLTKSKFNGRVYCCQVPNGIVYIRHTKNQQPFWCGNSRYAQKGTIGLLLRREDMPFTKDGIVPDIIINPLSIPSRMTIGKLIEVLASKVGSLKGERVNATSFRHFNIQRFMEQLPQYGFSRTGKEELYSGETGQPINGMVYIGPCYYQALRHHVLDKYMMRSRGAVKSITRQPIKGRKYSGAIRLGEMERDAIITHGASSLIRERLIVSSDLYTTTVCTNCGNLAIPDALNNKIYCKSCLGECKLGRVNIPYSYKYFLQTLQGSGITIKMITKEEKI